MCLKIRVFSDKMYYIKSYFYYYFLILFNTLINETTSQNYSKLEFADDIIIVNKVN